MCAGCQFQGVTYIEGQVLPGGDRGCQDCTCSVSETITCYCTIAATVTDPVLCFLSPQSGEVVCVQRRCPTMPCPHPALDGCACAVCDGCRFNGRDCFNGERFPHPTDHCQLCSCLVHTTQNILTYIHKQSYKRLGKSRKWLCTKNRVQTR